MAALSSHFTPTGCKVSLTLFLANMAADKQMPNVTDQGAFSSKQDSLAFRDDATLFNWH